jgi:hypothetical protein
MLAPITSVGPGRVLHKSVQAGEPEAMPKFQEKLLTRFVTSCGAAFCLREAHSCILAGNHIANARRARQPIRSRSARDGGAPQQPDRLMGHAAVQKLVQRGSWLQ